MLLSHNSIRNSKSYYKNDSEDCSIQKEINNSYNHSTNLHDSESQIKYESVFDANPSFKFRIKDLVHDVALSKSREILEEKLKMSLIIIGIIWIIEGSEAEKTDTKTNLNSSKYRANSSGETYPYRLNSMTDSSK